MHTETDMVRGIGIDIVENRRFRSPKDGLLKRIFTSREIEEGERRANRDEYYASRFASKEAFVKALGTGFRAIQPSDVEIMEDELGRPYIVRTEKLEEVLKDTEILLSISHERENSIAMVVLDGKI